MRVFNLSFEMDNAAFVDDGEGGASEARRILHEVGDKALLGQVCGPVYDLNGNRVGAWAMAEAVGE